MAKLLSLDASGTKATIKDASAADVITGIFSPDANVTGAYGVAQKAALVALGFLGGNYVHSDNMFSFGGHSL